MHFDSSDITKEDIEGFIIFCLFRTKSRNNLDIFTFMELERLVAILFLIINCCLERIEDPDFQEIQNKKDLGIEI